MNVQLEIVAQLGRDNAGIGSGTRFSASIHLGNSESDGSSRYREPKPLEVGKLRFVQFQQTDYLPLYTGEHGRPEWLQQFLNPRTGGWRNDIPKTGRLGDRPFTIIEKAECVSELADSNLFLCAVILLAAKFSQPRHFYLLPVTMIPGVEAAKCGFLEIPYTGVYFLDARKARIPATGCYFHASAPKFHPDDRARLDAQVQKFNMFGWHSLVPWRWISARKSRLDDFGDTIYCGEDYLRCERNFTGEGDHTLSLRSARQLFEAIFESGVTLERVCDQLREKQTYPIAYPEPLHKYHSSYRSEWEERMVEPAFCPTPQKWSDPILELARQVAELPHARHIPENDVRLFQLERLKLPGDNAAAKVEAFLGDQPVFLQPKAVEEVFAEFLRVYRSIQGLSVSEDIESIRNTAGEREKEPWLSEYLGESQRNYGWVRQPSYMPSIQRALDLIAGDCPMPQERVRELLYAKGLVKNDEEFRFLCNRRGSIECKDGAFWISEQLRLLEKINALKLPQGCLVNRVQLSELAAELKEPEAAIQLVTIHSPTFRRDPENQNALIRISADFPPALRRALVAGTRIRLSELAQRLGELGVELGNSDLRDGCIFYGCTIDGEFATQASIPNLEFLAEREQLLHRLLEQSGGSALLADLKAGWMQAGRQAGLLTRTLRTAAFLKLNDWGCAFLGHNFLKVPENIPSPEPAESAPNETK